VIARLGSALRRSLRIAAERPRASLWVLAAATCALVAAGAAAIAADNIDRWAGEPRGKSASMVVYLGDGTDEAGAQRLATELGRVPGVEQVEVVAPAETARRLQQALGPDSTLLDGVDVATLPPSLEVVLAPGTRDVLEMSPTMHALRAAPGVVDIAIEDGGGDHSAGVIAAVRTGAWIVAALLAAVALVALVAVLRVRLERGRRERQTLALLGASPSFTIVPTALAGALHGLVAAGAAAIALAVLVASYGDAFGSLQLAAPAPLALAWFVALGAGLGLVGGGLAGAASEKA